MLELFQNTWAYASSHGAELLWAIVTHLALVGVSLGVATAVCLPLGIWTAHNNRYAPPILNLGNSLRVIPSIAVLFLLIPLFGLSFTSAVIALIMLAIPPIILNTDAAYRGIDPAIQEAATGMGYNPWQQLLHIKTPLALPVIIAGLRTATTEVIASATLAAFIGIGGLGLFIVRGLALYNLSIMLVGVIPIILLTLAADGLWAILAYRSRLPA
jgi:osmoprotectant transport system permease protein